ncbi:MAG: FAD-dependent oxidoreductase [Deltaproteobacteria bacterium]|nr:FAD-dependent oxidoreductase [Deltaproteobacteria bacterium]
MSRPQNYPLSISTKGTQDHYTGRWGVLKPFFDEKLSPCRHRCPGSIHIPKFMNLVQDQNLTDAWRTICEENPMPRITGRVCFHPCEEDCLRQNFDQPIAIHQVERFDGDWAFKNGLRHFEPTGDLTGPRLAVIGSGPAGIGCCYHLLRLGYQVSLFEAMPELGGLLRYGIPGYRLPKDVLSEELEMILGSWVGLHPGVKIGRDISWEEIQSDFEGIFLGPGAQQSISLGLEGEELGGVADGLDFLKTVEANPFIRPGQRVLILGGGNTAFDVARAVLRLQGLPLILYRRSKEEMPAFEDEIMEAEEEGIEVRTLISPRGIVRDEEGLKGLTCVRNRITDLGPEGRRGFVPIEGSDHFMAGDFIVTAFGHLADAEALPSGVKVVHGSVTVTAQGAAGSGGVFAGGDVTAAPRSVIHALASGKRGALGLDAYFKHQKEVRPDKFTPLPLVKADQINLHYFSQSLRMVPERRLATERVSDFHEIQATLTPEAAAQEASRCVKCGFCNACGNCAFFCPDLAVCLDPGNQTILIDDRYCKGCCICVEECPRGVLSVEVET